MLHGGSSSSETGRVNLHDWIDELCDALDIEVEVDEAVVLDLARDAAHAVERRAAPVSTFLLGYAAARSDGDPQEVERLAGLASALALRWDRSPDEPDALDALDEEDDTVDALVDPDPAAGPVA